MVDGRWSMFVKGKLVQIFNLALYERCSKCVVSSKLVYSILCFPFPRATHASWLATPFFFFFFCVNLLFKIDFLPKTSLSLSLFLYALHARHNKKTKTK